MGASEGTGTVVNVGLVLLAQAEFSPDAVRYGGGSEKKQTLWELEAPDPITGYSLDPLSRLRSAVRHSRRK